MPTLTGKEGYKLGRQAADVAAGFIGDMVIEEGVEPSIPEIGAILAGCILGLWSVGKYTPSRLGVRRLWANYQIMRGVESRYIEVMGPEAGRHLFAQVLPHTTVAIQEVVGACQ